MTMPSVDALTVAVEAFYAEISTDDRNGKYAGHWWDHVSRVVRNARRLISVEECGNPDALVAAALCHDMSLDSVPESANLCRDYSQRAGFSQKDSDYAASLVLATDRDVKTPTSHDERLLYVADKLDLFGFDGTVRLLIEHQRAGISVRDELKAIASQRQADWLQFMHSLNVGHAIIDEAAETAHVLLDSLAPVEI